MVVFHTRPGLHKPPISVIKVSCLAVVVCFTAVLWFPIDTALFLTFIQIPVLVGQSFVFGTVFNSKHTLMW